MYKATTHPSDQCLLKICLTLFLKIYERPIQCEGKKRKQQRKEDANGEK